jgi:hypothetical protein
MDAFKFVVAHHFGGRVFHPWLAKRFLLGKQ